MTLQKIFETIIKSIKSHRTQQIVEEAANNWSMASWHEGHVRALTKVANDLAHFCGCVAPEEKKESGK